MGNIYSLKFKDENGKTFTFSRSSAGSILYSQTLKKYTHSQRFTIECANETGIQLYINDANSPADSNTLYAIGSSGIEAIGSATELTVLTGSGTETVEIKNSGPELIADAYVVTGSGWGHNVGMSQYGALAMANMGFSCEDIIKFYFTGVSIE
jgi:stage II sporulation protein D